ncbi:MAG: hypothetical protein GC154_04470 [bacterium]|nr:hypothetical protein [bacterium]
MKADFSSLANSLGIASIDWRIAVVLAVISAPVYWGLYKLMFRDFDEYIDAWMFWITPDMWSWMNDQLLDDLWAEFKLSLWSFGCVAAVSIEYWAVDQWVL